MSHNIISFIYFVCLEYLDYFERTYVRGRKVAHCVKEATFPPSMWNCNKAAVQGLPRTNNAMEGWHRSFNDRFPKSKMALSQFLIRLMCEEEKTRQLDVRFGTFLISFFSIYKTCFRARANPAECIRQLRTTAIQKRNDNLKLLVEHYNARKVSTRDERLDFLQNIQHHLAKFAFTREADEVVQEEAKVVEEVAEVLNEVDQADLPQLPIDMYGIKIQKEDMEKLFPKQWLNDNLINIYLELLARDGVQNVSVFLLHFNFFYFICRFFHWILIFIRSFARKVVRAQ